MIKGLYEAHLPVSNLISSIDFYERLGLTLASKGEKVAFFWIDKGESWLGLWEGEEVNTPYHPSLRHIAFHVDFVDMLKAKEWLENLGIEIRTSFGFSKERQPLVLPNFPHSHAAIYFNDPDGNSLELITPLRLDGEEDFSMMEIKEWFKKQKGQLK